MNLGTYLKRALPKFRCVPQPEDCGGYFAELRVWAGKQV